jgi:hypothetical protein
MELFSDDFNPLTPSDYDLPDGTKYWFSKGIAIIKFNGFDMFSSMGEIHSKAWESVARLRWSNVLCHLMWRMPYAKRELRGWNPEQPEINEAYKTFLDRRIFN